MRDPQLARLVKALPGFDVVEALARLNGNIAFYQELLADLCAYLDAALSALGPLIHGGGTEETLIRLHGLKGMCANLGATNLKQVFEKMEMALSDSRENRYEMLITRMEQTIQQNLAAIGAALKAEAPPSPEPPLPDAATDDLLAETMHLLARLLDRKRLDAVDAFKQLESLLNHQAPHPAFSSLSAAMRRLDYDAARKALTVLAASTNIVLR
jgi:HPt (histidine-containing phosphotransfer) domain-containing protein